MATDAELAWLAGIIDGEGSITAQVITRRDGRICITPFVGIVNTDGGIVESCVAILRSVDVKTQVYAKPLGEKFGKLPCVQIRVDGHKAMAKLLPLLIPHLHSVKRQYAQQILVFIQSRAAGLFTHDERGRIRRCEYTAAQVEMISRMRTHASAKSLDTLRAAPNVGKSH